MSAPIVQIQGKAYRRRSIRVMLEDGISFGSDFNGDVRCSRREIRRYYLGRSIQCGDTEECPKDKMVKIVAVRFLV